MLHLRTFGELSIWREGESAPIQTVPRRSLALLAILASTRSSGVSRERVIGILWPESDSESAKASLRQAVFATRRELASDDVILGSNELSLNPAVVTSDVNQFASAVTAKKYEQAVELHRGPFLDGVPVRSSAEFERWAESQRSSLAGEYKYALEQLASIASAQGESVKAVGWWRKLAAEDPLSSRYAAGLMEALIAAGDSGAALSHYRVHESLVSEELSSVPDPAVSLIARRAREPGAAAPRTPSNAELGHASFDKKPVPAGEQFESTTPFPAHFAPSSAVVPAEPIREAPANRVWKYRGQAMLAAAVVGAGVLVALAFVARGRREPESARRVVIAPFENKTGDRQLDPLGAMTSDWITDGLSRTGLVSVIDPGTAFFAAKDARERTGSISGNSTAVKAISLATDADIVTTGDYFRKGDSLEFHARVTDARNNRVIASMDPVTVAAAAPTAAVQVVRQRVLGILARELDPRLSDVIQEQSAPPTFDAYRAYTVGLQFFITRHDYESAAIQFRHAYLIDTSFASALLWASLVYAYEGKTDLSRALMDTLLPKRNSLTPLDAYALDAMRAYDAGQIESSITAAKAAAAIAPQSQWVWNAGYWSIYALRPHEAIALFESLDPTRGWLKGWNEYWIKLAGAQHMIGDYRGEQETIKRGLQVVPSDGRLQSERVQNLAAQGRTQPLDSAVNAMLASSDPIFPARIAHLIFELREHGQSADADRLSARAEPYFVKWSGTYYGKLDFGDLYFMSHRWKDARRQFELALAAPGGERLYLLGRIGACAAALGDTAAAIAIADSLARYAGPHKAEASFSEAIVLARLHRRPEAVTLLRQSYALGYRKTEYIRHTTRYLFPDLWGYPPFEEFFKQD